MVKKKGDVLISGMEALFRKIHKTGNKQFSSKSCEDYESILGISGGTLHVKKPCNA